MRSLRLVNLPDGKVRMLCQMTKRRAEELKRQGIAVELIAPVDKVSGTSRRRAQKSRVHSELTFLQVYQRACHEQHRCHIAHAAQPPIPEQIADGMDSFSQISKRLLIISSPLSIRMQQLSPIILQSISLNDLINGFTLLLFYFICRVANRNQHGSFLIVNKTKGLLAQFCIKVTDPAGGEALLNGMAKVQIKSERITPFGGIFQVRELFSRFVGPVIDKVLGLRCTSFGEANCIISQHHYQLRILGCSKNSPTFHGLRDFSWGLQELLDFSFKFLVDYHAAVVNFFRQASAPLHLHRPHGVNDSLFALHDLFVDFLNEERQYELHFGS